jgi:hypothetical protein
MAAAESPRTIGQLGRLLFEMIYRVAGTAGEDFVGFAPVTAFAVVLLALPWLGERLAAGSPRSASLRSARRQSSCVGKGGPAKAE